MGFRQPDLVLTYTVDYYLLAAYSFVAALLLLLLAVYVFVAAIIYRWYIVHFVLTACG